MKVICNEHNKCQFKSVCEHSKPHEMKFQCHVKNNQIEKRFAVSSCCCEVINLKQYRKLKLEKIYEGNM